ncbi:FadR/GntR family transcriptional regulator [Caproicibacter fermentans]|nr:FadR/GntR family transcriptional regulator [Caproicibacter fermentans]
MQEKTSGPSMDHKTLIERTTNEIIKIIQDKNYQPGDKLPNEYELGGMLGVSRNTAREALRALASNNVIEIRQGAGTFISKKMGVPDDPLGFSMIKDKNKLTRDLLQLRCVIEPPIAALAAQNSTPQEIANLEVSLLEVEGQIAQHTRFAEKDRNFHAQIARCSGNLVVSNLIPIISEGVTVFSTVVSRQEFEQTLKSHRCIFEAIRDRRPVEAEQAMLFHLLYNMNRFHLGN